MIRYTTFCDNFQHLEAFSHTVLRGLSERGSKQEYMK
jgi:hypothetical protein